MNESFEENELINVAMQIILHAGDARTNTNLALELVKTGDFEGAKIEMKKANENIRLAHVSQTEVIQNESRGKAYTPSLLFNHAQDTLMTINSEVKLAAHIIDIFEVFDKKYGNREEK